MDRNSFMPLTQQWLSLHRFFTARGDLRSNFSADIKMFEEGPPPIRFAFTTPCISLSYVSRTEEVVYRHSRHAPATSTLHDVLFLPIFFLNMFEHLKSLFLRPCSCLFLTCSTISSSSPLQSTPPTGGWSLRSCRALLLLVSSSVSLL